VIETKHLRLYGGVRLARLWSS